ncbi:hypothetical protein [Streptacidiphilus monticola]|uniref:Uncharacterized protein n=1 Tax=Streptacidiphilus monticola TaxID=2161674 RepID=A0ABW1G4W0_9ACTN
MDLVRASLYRRLVSGLSPPGENAEVLGALWAHAVPEDGLEHVFCRPEADRVDLLLFLLTRSAGDPDGRSALDRAEGLLHRSHQASPVLRSRFLPPQVTAA